MQEDCRREYLSSLVCGDVIDACVTHMEPFGAFCDIGAGISALLPIDSISVSRIPHPNARFSTGQNIRAIVKSCDELGRITLSHRELLGTWEENSAAFKAGETVPGPARADKIFHGQPTHRFVGLFAGGVRESDRKRILRRKSDMKKTGRFNRPVQSVKKVCHCAVSRLPVQGEPIDGVFCTACAVVHAI